MRLSSLLLVGAAAALQGCGSCVGEQADDKASSNNSSTTKIPPQSADKVITMDTRRDYRGLLEAGD